MFQLSADTSRSNGTNASLMPFSENKGNVNVGFTGEYAPKLKIEFYRSNESSQWDQEG